MFNSVVQKYQKMYIGNMGKNFFDDRVRSIKKYFTKCIPFHVSKFYFSKCRLRSLRSWNLKLAKLGGDVWMSCLKKYCFEFVMDNPVLNISLSMKMCSNAGYYVNRHACAIVCLIGWFCLSSYIINLTVKNHQLMKVDIM